MKTFGERLRVLRREKGLNQQDLADHIGIARGTLAHYETCKREPEFLVLIRLADFFGVSIDYMLGQSEIRGTSGPGTGRQHQGEQHVELASVMRGLPPDQRRKMIHEMIRIAFPEDFIGDK